MPDFASWRVLGLGLALGASAASADSSASRFEAPPTLPTTRFVAASQLAGADYRIEPEVSTDGFLADFTVVSEFGTFHVRGRELLHVRVAEIRALRTLEAMRHHEVLLDGVKDEMRETGAAIQHAVENPVETAKGIPAGVGRFFERTIRAGKTGVQVLQDRRAEQAESGESLDSDDASEIASDAARLTADALGLDEERRNLSKELGVDPYTTNPVLFDKLDRVAQAAFAGSLGVRVATSQVPAGSILAATRQVSDLVWDHSAGDLYVIIDRELKAIGVAQEEIDLFLRHEPYSVTLRVVLQTALSEMAGVADRAAVVSWALSADSEDEARFVALSASMLARYHAEVAQLERIEILGPLGGRTRQGELVALGPIDYLAWTERAQQFFTREDLVSPRRSLWITGEVSPRARESLAQHGWTLREWALRD